MDYLKENTIKLLQGLREELADGFQESIDWSLGKQTSTITGWNLTEAVEAIAFEYKERNEIERKRNEILANTLTDIAQALAKK